MKKILFSFLALAIICASSANAAGTADVGIRSSATIRMPIIQYVADSADATFPAVTIKRMNGALSGVYIDEGTVPTDGTITVAVKISGTDINLLGANGVDVSLSAGYATIPSISTATSDLYLADFVGDLTVEITGGGVNSANPVVILTIRE